jgi:hypothetical protein
MSNGQDSLSVADDFDIKNQALYLPVPHKAGKYDNSFALAIIYLPTDWLEQSLSIPMFDYKANFAIGKGFTLNAYIKTLIIANDFRLGASWNRAINKNLYFGIGYQLGFNFGLLNSYGFDNTIKVIQHHPIIRLGLEKNNRAYTVLAKLDIIGLKSISAAENETLSVVRSRNGYSLGFYFEQRIFKQKAFFIGAVANFNQFHILGWPAFNTVKKLYFIPEINFGFDL